MLSKDEDGAATTKGSQSRRKRHPKYKIQWTQAEVSCKSAYD